MGDIFVNIGDVIYNTRNIVSIYHDSEKDLTAIETVTDTVYCTVSISEILNKLNECGCSVFSRELDEAEFTNQDLPIVGDKVTVRKDLIIGKSYGNVRFVEGMVKYAGKHLTVCCVSQWDDTFRCEESDDFWWDIGMIEEASE